ncbi:5-oxoprolinase subunit PxpB [Pelistega sp. MC2]|uniref:5-oxoprolinase subunit PxpB n=1 Tax=Pelistega sp. MC2 TaxID=1720297 RepID=UPI0008DAC834|nr:5-oxoprolinase subunit PxpB [Pelistega sp. MC2]
MIPTDLSYTFDNEGDNALIIRLSRNQPFEMPDILLNKAAILLAQKFNLLREQQKLPGILEAIPTFSTVGIYYDLDRINSQFLPRLKDKTSELWANVLTELSKNDSDTGKLVEIPICYDLEYGIDLIELSAQLNLSIEEIIQLHSQSPVRVFMLGFSPGLPYLGLFDKKLNIPRRPTPRTKLPAGSIAIANRQCVIYPYETPGGWHIVGATPLTLFNPNRQPKTLYQAGDLVQFKSISKEEFLHLKHI